ncbi:hypothetical protein IT087_03175 [Candidatus Uhrbacteria bacterium]|nr:hypothetical protein [Candidatus Uhrbacteria bacterium]
MKAKRSLSYVQLALHMSEFEIVCLLGSLGLNREPVPREQRAWSHVPKSDDTVILSFGRKGLKRVRAAAMMNQLIEHGFRHQGSVIAYKRAIDATGAEAVDHRSQPIWKFCLEINLEHAPRRSPEPMLAPLSAFIAAHIWKRGRVFQLPDPGGNRDAVIELVQPSKSRPSVVTDLHFERPGIFVKRLVNLP